MSVQIYGPGGKLSQMFLDSLRSDEEKQFVFWLEEAKGAGLVMSYQYEVDSFELFGSRSVSETVRLKTKTKVEQRHIHRSESYTPDFRLQLTELGEAVLYKIFRKSMAVRAAELSPHDLFIDVKGAFSFHQTDDRYFSIVRKAMLSRHGIWVSKVVPKEFFKVTWLPEVYRWMKKRKVPTLTAAGSRCGTVSDFMGDHVPAKVQGSVGQEELF